MIESADAKVKSSKVKKQRTTGVIPVRLGLDDIAVIKVEAAEAGVSVNAFVAQALTGDAVKSVKSSRVVDHVDILSALPAELDAALHKRSESTGIAVPVLLEKAVRELLRPHKGKK